MNITDPYAAYCFDQAVLHFGRGVEAAMDSVNTKGKKPNAVAGARENVLRRYLGMKPKFADIRLLGRGGRKESGSPPKEDKPDLPFRME